MEKSFSTTQPKLVRYAYETFKPEDPILSKVRKIADERGIPAIQVGEFDGLHLEVLVRMSKAKKAIEIGTLAGYSAIRIARALPEDGHLHTFEFDPLHAKTARESI